MPSPSWLLRAATVALFLAVTVVFTHPLGTSPATVSLDLGPDTRLFLWTLGWDVHSLTSDPLAIFDANIFFPETSTLAYSEHQIGSALLAAPVVVSSGNLVLGLNVVLLLSCALSGLAAYYLGRQIGLSRTGALVAGLVFALAPPRFFRLGQLHLATVQWIPLTLALLHRYARGGTRRHLVASVAAFTLQALSGGQSALFLALASAALVAYLGAIGELRPRSPLLGDAAWAGALLLALNVPFVVPYVEVRADVGLERGLDEAESWSPNARSFVASPTHLHRLVHRSLGTERRVLGQAKAYLFPGIVPLLLALAAFSRSGRTPAPRPRRDAPRFSARLGALDAAIVLAVAAALFIEANGGVHVRLGSARFSASGGERAALVALGLLVLRVAAFRRTGFAYGPALRRARDAYVRWAGARMGAAGSFYLLLSFVSLWASLGPSAWLYEALYRLVPGFDFVRVPSRLTLLTVTGLAVLAGIGADRISRRARALAPLAILLLLVEMAAFPLDVRAYEVQIPPMDRWLRDEGAPGPAAVLPIPDPRDDLAAARRHSAYMLYSTAHYRPIVNGYSGFTPARHDRLFRTLARFPTEEGIRALEELGVRYAVLHRDGYPETTWREVVDRAASFAERLAPVAVFEEGRIYELTRRSRRDGGS